MFYYFDMIRFDFDEISAIANLEISPTIHELNEFGFYLCLSLLSSARERWRWGDISDNDWDDTLAFVDLTINQLIGGTSLNELIAALNEIRDAITDLDLGREDCDAEFSDDFTDDVDGWTLEILTGNWELLHGSNNALRLKYNPDASTFVECKVSADVDVLLGNGSVLFASWFSGSTDMDEVTIYLYRDNGTIITTVSQFGPLDEGVFVKSLSSYYERVKKIEIFVRKDLQTGTINFYLDAIALMCG